MQRLCAQARPDSPDAVFADPAEIETATALATAQLNARAKPWVWGRPPPPHRRLRRKITYRL